MSGYGKPEQTTNVRLFPAALEQNQKRDEPDTAAPTWLDLYQGGPSVAKAYRTSTVTASGTRNDVANAFRLIAMPENTPATSST
jgi:hypothetical protein